MIMKAAAELSSKTDKPIAFNERSSMGVMVRRTDQVDNSTIAFPLRTHEKLRSCEVALDELKFRDQFVSSNRCLNKFQVARLYELICDDRRKSTKACLSYLLSPELVNTYTFYGTKSKFGISKYKFYRTAQSKSTKY
ncbi:unnamed protein product [Schistosoma mattheei]|uniref:Uncharacterized protein n=1 Tax=Schistosoma mattheei TaxID=31246 RepID=A0A183Q1N3_9TREM|nr:unnamed protein product [Schistosoma mattheei]